MARRRLTYLFGCLMSFVLPFGDAHALTSGTSSPLHSAPAVRDTLDRLAGIPVEYKADILFNILSQWPASVTLKQKRQLLEDLFTQAPQAVYAAPLIDVTGNDDSVTHQEELNLGWMPFDALDIQARSVSLMRPLSRRTSWSMLQRISLQPRRYSCSDASTAQYEPYYNVLASTVSAYNNGPLPNGESQASFLIETADAVAAPAQLEGFLQAIATLNLTAPDYTLLVSHVTAALSRINPSDRDMSGAESHDLKLTHALSGIIEKSKQLGLDPNPLLLGYRAFLIKGLHQTACSDHTLDRAAEAAGFNALDPARIGPNTSPVKPLTAETLHPEAVKGSAAVELIGGAPDVQTETHRLFLVFNANQAVSSTSPEDAYLQPNANDVSKVLRHAVDDTSLSNASPLCVFETRQSTLELLVDLLPPGPSLRDATNADVSYLSFNSIETVNPEAWLRGMRKLIMISRPVDPQHPETAHEQGSENKTQILRPSLEAAAIRDSLRSKRGDPIIGAYMAFEETFRPYYTTFAESRKAVDL